MTSGRAARAALAATTLAVVLSYSGARAEDGDERGTRAGDVPAVVAAPTSPATPARPAQVRDADGVGGGASASASGADQQTELSEQGRSARGLYMNARSMRRTSARRLVTTLQRLHFDAVVIDVKDSSGNVYIDTHVPELRPQSVRRHRIRHLREKLAELRAAGIYTIARVSCFSDNQLPRRRRDLAVRHQRDRQTWVSGGTGGTWLDPHNTRNHEIILALALEVQALGFDELQLDYVRFPVDGATAWATFPAAGEGTRVDALVSLLRTLDAGLHIPIGVDVFGLAAYREGDPSGLGQDLVRWLDHVEVISPMLYLNAMRDWRVGQANRAHTLVEDGVAALRARVGEQVVIRPYLQAFATGADEFNPRFFAAQIRGARQGGSDGFLFWHTASRYTMLEGSWRRIRDLYPFPRATSARAAATPPAP